MDEQDAKEKIRTAIRDAQYVWRTVRGIAADTGVPEETVLQIIETADGFLRAYRRNRQGLTLYSTTEKYRKDATWKQKILDAITNKVGV